MAEALVAVERLPHAADLPLPACATAGAAGVDLLAAVAAGAPLLLRPGARALVPTGIRLALPAGLEAQVRSRSGLALRHGIVVLNSPGTIDGDYRGEVGVILINHGEDVFEITRGMRVAQLVLSPVLGLRWDERFPAEPEGGRGAKGFGSTGIKEEGMGRC